VFLRLPIAVSAKLPRRGRTSVHLRLLAFAGVVCLEPDGAGSHWLPISAELWQASGLAGHPLDQPLNVTIDELENEPEPKLPQDLASALKTTPAALATWQATSTLARVDWIHWLDSAKQAKTRTKRIEDALSKLSAGELRVCCFDTSGIYSKALKPPVAA
jgi:hypothetical protein